jgi:hypothetical protein
MSIDSGGPFSLGAAAIIATLVTELAQWIYRLVHAKRVADELELQKFVDAFSVRASEYFMSLSEKPTIG